MTAARRRWLAVAVAWLAATPLAAQDVAEGEKQFRKCRACHQVGEDAAHGTGPALNGIVGAAIAAREGYEYSDALRAFAQSAAVWTEERLNRYLEKPRALVPGTRMSFAGLRRPEDRADVIAYLAGFGGAVASSDAGFVVAREILALEGDPEYGAYLAGECTTCHQTSGDTDGIPAIVGLDGDTFVTAMHAYRDGAREHPVMQMIAGRLGDEEIAALAAYFEDPDT